MSITFINTQTRPNTSIAFYSESNLPATTRVKNICKTIPNINFTSAISSDQLTLTNTTILDTIENFSTYYNLIADLNMSVELQTYRTSNPGVQSTRSASGDFPKFAMTTTYNCPNGTDIPCTFSGAATTIDRLKNLDSGHLTNVEVLTDTIILTHTYENVADFSSSHYNDVLAAQDLVNAGVTKTVTITTV